MRTYRKRNSRTPWVIAAAAAAALGTVAGLSHAGTTSVPGGNTTSLRNTTGGVTNVVPTVSLSGSTAMRSFIISPGFTLLNTTAGNSITLGPTGNAITYSLGASASLQFAQGNFNTNDVTSGLLQSHSALRIEWHEQGSVEGMLELADSQIDDNIYNNTIYNPSTGNATYVNRNKFGGTGAAVFPPATLGGHTLNNNTTSFTVRDAQAQSPVQMAISDVKATQGFAKGGVAFENLGAFNRTPTQSGYGKGNPALPAGALGTPGARFALNDESALNMANGAANPNGGTYGSGAWNTAGVGNLNSKTVAHTATLFAANPGTGLTKLNRTDAQWLQLTGRLKNGADFNMTTRDVGSGTRNVAATNTGIDASWASGENDAGNGNSLTGGTDQTAIGAGITFSNKTAGGAQLRPVVQRSRMAIGTLGMADGIGVFKATGTNVPLRALDYRDDADDVSNNSNGGGHKNWSDTAGSPTFTTGDLATGTFIRASAASITNGAYVIYQNQQFVTVQRPDADYATDKVKGDNTGDDAGDVRDNIINAVLTFGTGTSVATPADSMLDNSFILPQLMLVAKATDGVNVSDVNPGRSEADRATFLADSRAANFNPADPATIKQGSSATYGANVAHVILNGDGTITNVAPLGGSIATTANNYFFGDFKRDNADPSTGNREVRDYSDISVAQQAQGALKLGGSTHWDDGGDLNSRSVPNAGGFVFTADMGFTPTKGDLIAMGDFNSDGGFDGKDLYLMARGSALADSTGSTTLSGGSNAFADKVRTGVLRKNAALDLLDSTATPQQKADARANATNDPSGTNAFNKRDVNRDGLVDFVDGVTSDKFFNQDYTNIDQQLAATGDVRVGAAVTPISLVDVELTDSGNINQSDLDVINTSLAGTKNETWTGTLKKTGGGTISTAYTGGTFKVNTGATLQIDAGTVNVGGSADMFTDNTGTATNGNHLAVVNNSTTTLNLTAGSKAVSTLTGAGNSSVSAGATLTADYVRQNQLTAHGAVSMRPNNAHLATSSELNGLVVGASGKLDLTDNNLVVHGGDLTGLTALVTEGRGDGTWNGTRGITTSMTDATSSLLTTLAIANADDVGLSGSVWGGVSVNSGDVLVKYTWGGDADLNGELNGDDYFWIDSSILAQTPGFHYGDFDYNGETNGDDYFILDSNILFAQASQPFASSAAAEGVAGGLTAVPEPGLSGLLFAVAGFSLSRASRRRRR